MVRYLAICGVILSVLTVGWVCRREYQNSRSTAFPSDAEVQASLARATDWVLSRRDSLLQEDNPMLWLFIREGAKASGNPRLLQLAQDYQAQHTDNNLWRFIFDSSGHESVAAQYIELPASWPDYNHLFIYGATCNTSLRMDPAVLSLLSPEACGSTLASFRAAWCHTHQLMGLRFVQRNHCEPDDESAQTVAAVQKSILTEQSWDFRVEDAYIQRVLMLVESGRRQDVKAAWLRQILDAQSTDGGWTGVETIAELPGNRVLCWGSHWYPNIAHRHPSGLHATAQALYLLALWRADNLLSAGFLTEAGVGPALGSQ